MPFGYQPHREIRCVRDRAAAFAEFRWDSEGPSLETGAPESCWPNYHYSSQAGQHPLNFTMAHEETVRIPFLHSNR